MICRRPRRNHHRRPFAALLAAAAAVSTAVVVAATDDEGNCEVVDRDLGRSCQSEDELEDSGYADPSLNSLEQEDPALAEAARDKFLFPPAANDVPYNFTQKTALDMRGQFGQTKVIEEIFKGRWPKSGFFVEAGAYDGEYISNTLLFEIKYGWSGLLVEPNPDVFEELQMKHRKAWTLNNCLSTKTTPEMVEFDAIGLYGGIVNQANRERRPGDDVDEGMKRNGEAKLLHVPAKGMRRMALRMQCLPLYSLLVALDNPTVHYLVLDIEGAEMGVLKTIPWDKVDIKVVQVETTHLGDIFKDGSHRKLDRLMNKAGYDRYKLVEHDTIYLRRDFFQ